jgi:ketosteroid isomerase-like protein
MSHRYYVVALAVLAAACAKPETMEQVNARMANEAATARSAIEQQNAAMARHMAAGHADSVATFYAADARVMGNNEPVANGREAIANNLRGMMGMGTFHLTLNTDSVWANGPLVVERGKYTYHFALGPSAPPGMDSTGSGSYMVRWVKEGDRWVMADDIWNSDRPMMPMPRARNR